MGHFVSRTREMGTPIFPQEGPVLPNADQRTLGYGQVITPFVFHAMQISDACPDDALGYTAVEVIAWMSNYNP